MTWVKLDDGFHSHPKVLLVGDAGAGLFARALSYCSANLTDGWVPRGFTARRQMADKLTGAGLWVPVEKGQTFSYDMRGGRTYTVIVPGCGWFIPDYLMLNPDAESERERRRVRHEAKVEAGKIGAARRWQKA